MGTKYNQNQNSKMKFLGVLIGVAAAATAMSYDEKVMCLCCLDGFQWYCCATCLLTGGGDDRNADVQSKVAESLTSIQADLNEIETKACGKCAICFMTGEYCSECSHGDDGCPVESYKQIEAAISIRKED